MQGNIHRPTQGHRRRAKQRMWRVESSVLIISPEVTPSWSLAAPVLPRHSLPHHQATFLSLIQLHCHSIAAPHAVIPLPPTQVHTAGFASCFGCDSLAGHCANPHSSPGG